MNRRVAAIIGTGLSVWVAFWLLHTTPQLPPKHRQSVAQQLPELDGLRPVGWLSPLEVLLTRDVADTASCQVFNLATKTISPLSVRLPGLPKSTDTTRYERSLPTPSPDGKWLLYLDSHLRVDEDRSTLLSERWSVVSRADRKTRCFPQDGAFQETPPNRSGGIRSTVHWLPDSSGWVVRRYLESATGRIYRKVEFCHYRLNPPGTPPEILSPPTDAQGWLNDPFDNPAPTWLGLTAEGELAFASVGKHQLTLFSNTSPKQKKLPLPFPKGYSYAMAPSFHGPLFMAEGPQLARGNRSLLAPLRFQDKSSTESWEVQQRSPMELWFLPLNGGTPEKLTTLPSGNNLYHYSLAPGGKSLLYWEGQKATLLTWK